MATPLSGPDLARVLRAGGLTVVEEPGWLTNNRNRVGAWGPVEGILHHHTVTQGDTPAQERSSINLCFNGHSALPGPLCHGVITKRGVVHLVGNGRANHAGLGDEDTLRAMLAGREPGAPDNNTRDGNRLFYGFESINLGDGVDPWPAAQVMAMELVSAALTRHHAGDGWDEYRTAMHKEWQAGKIDPRGPGFPSGASFRANVRTRLASDGEDDMPLTAEEIERIAERTAYKVAAFKNTNLDSRDVFQILRDGAADAKRAADRSAEIRVAIDHLDLTNQTPASLQAIAAAVADEIARRGAE